MKEMNEDELIKMMVGRSLTNIFPPPVCEPDYSKVVFEAKNLTDNDGKLKDVSFQVFKGEVLGIAGLAVCHAAGVVQFSIVTGNTIPASFLAVSVPYIVKDVISVVVAEILGVAVRKALSAAHVMNYGTAA